MSKRTRRTRRQEWDHVDSIANTIIGVLFGILVGTGVGLGISKWGSPFTILFPGDVILASVLACGILGYRFGDPFLDWLSRNWSEFFQDWS